MHTFPEVNFSIAPYIDGAVKWCMLHFQPFFDFVSSILLWLMVKTEHFLLWLPWWLVIIATCYFGWKATRRIAVGLGMGAALALIGVLGMWEPMMQTLAIVGAAVVVSLILGIPTGIMMARSNAFEAAIKPILDAMQTLPSFVYLIPAMMFFGLGKVPAIMATVIYAIPPIIRLTNLGIRQVPEEVVEAGKAFGCTPMQLLTKIQIPLAMPTIMSGINQTTMMALAMVVVASMIGAQGMGELVLLALSRIEVGNGFEAGLGIVILAIVIDRVLQGFGQQKQRIPQ
ncbi:MAG: proline/glycine betaine ABC transporter permease [Peptococcaceae bacterium]|nr:proline/glycine betaine ABC transporter permease [Peptococcaceae bacterium]